MPEEEAATYSGHWDGVYANRPDQLTREWHCELGAISDVARPYIKQALAEPKPSGAAANLGDHDSGSQEEAGLLLVDVGCGGSSMAVDIRDSLGAAGSGLKLLLLDISSVIIDSMSARYAADRTVSCCVADCRALPVKNDACNLLLDKGTLDALHGDDDKTAMMQECKRILAPRGVMLSVSFGAVARLSFLSTVCSQLSLQHRSYVIGEGDPMSGYQVCLFTAIAHRFTDTAGDYAPDSLTSTVLGRVARTGSMYDDQTEEDATAYSIFQ